MFPIILTRFFPWTVPLLFKSEVIWRVFSPVIFPVFLTFEPVNTTFSPKIFPSFSTLPLKERISPAVIPEFLFIYLSAVIVK